jgi:hypothetical protein
MSTLVASGKAVFSLRKADHLHIGGGLVEIERSSPAGHETAAMPGEDLLVTIERAPAVEPEALPGGALGYPVGDPMD